MNRAHAPWLFVLVSVLTVLAAGCSGDGAEEPTTTTETVPSTTTTVDVDDTDGTDGTFRVGLTGQITTDNWWAALDRDDLPQNRAYLTNSKTSLFDLSLPGFVYVPGLAATETPVDPLPQGDVWVVMQPIRDDMTWSDGTPVTSADLALYFEVVREFGLEGDHADSFRPDVLDVTAADEHTLRIEFSQRPSLSTWQNGVGLASIPPAHFWQEHVEAARAAAEEAVAGVTDEEATAAIVADANGDDDPGNDLTPGQVTAVDIDEYLADARAAAGRASLYGVSPQSEPSVGPLIVEGWQPGVSAATIANPDFFESGSEKTLFSDGSIRIANGERGEDAVYGGQGAGDVVAHYLEGPFVSGVVWVEHESKEEAYEALASGDVDYVYDPDGMASALRNELAANSAIDFSSNLAEGFRYLAFNLRKAPMSDPAFRLAVATLINKELVAEEALAGAVEPGYTIVHPDLTAHYNPDVPRAGWMQDRPMSEEERYEAAIEILRENGYAWQTEPVLDHDANGVFVGVTPGEGLVMPNGVLAPEMTLLTPGPGEDPFRTTFSLWIEEWMSDLGIPVDAQPTDSESIVEAAFPPQTPASALDWDMYVLGWGSADPALPGAALRAFFHSDQDTARFNGFNTSGYASEEFDAIADAFDAATSVGEAARLTREMEAIVAGDLPYVVLFRNVVFEAFADDVVFPVDEVLGGHAVYPNGWPGSVSVGG